MELRLLLVNGDENMVIGEGKILSVRSSYYSLSFSFSSSLFLFAETNWLGFMEKQRDGMKG